MSEEETHPGEGRNLGMKRSIPRRDFVSGVGVALTGSLFPTGSVDGFQSWLTQQSTYPPALTGLRGSHDGSWETAHSLVRGTAWEQAARVDEEYDLIVVGGGISGLAAAHFFRKQVGGPDARILILDNHDDFGGHAKRNEFHHNGRTYLVNGGTLNVEAPSQYSPEAAGLLWDLGIDRTRYYDSIADVRERYADLGLSSGFFFDRETFGRDHLATGYGRRPWAEIAKESPLTEHAREDLVRLRDPAAAIDPWPNESPDAKKKLLAGMSYLSYLTDVLDVDPKVAFMHDSAGYIYCTGIDAVPALFAWNAGYPGFAALGLGPTPPSQLIDEPGGAHGRENQGRAGTGDPTMYFPDGNATITRLLVRGLIPGAISGSSMEDVVLADTDYGRLDTADSAVRIRLNSTVVNVRHMGSPDSADSVEVTYVRDGQARRVRGGAVVLACWNGVIPYLCPEMPETQREALSYGVKAPLVYTNVLLRNWESLVASGVSGASAPGGYHQSMSLATSLDFGGYRTSQDPTEPIVLRMSRYPYEPGHSKAEQHRRGRRDLLSTSFETFELKIRDQLARTFGPKGFDPEQDILGITVNRWPHGYSYTYNTLFDDPRWALGTPDDRPNVVGRQPYGRIAIANADAAASPHTDAAINEAYRAVRELKARLG
jgi:spermidine dehydrogenase